MRRKMGHQNPVGQRRPVRGDGIRRSPRPIVHRMILPTFPGGLWSREGRGPWGASGWISALGALQAVLAGGINVRLNYPEWCSFAAHAA